MSLLKKAITIIGITFLLLITAIYITSQTIILSKFSHLEEKNTEESLARVIRRISKEYESLNAIGRTLGAWDDTCVFIEDRNKNYIDTALINDNYTNMNTNFTFFLNKSGNIIYEKYFDVENNCEIKVPDDLRENILKFKNLLYSNKTTEGKYGIITCSKGPMLIIGYSIVKTNFEGPVKGIVIAGRHLNNKLMTQIQEDVNFPVTLITLNDNNISEDIKNNLLNSEEKNPIVIKPVDKNIIAGFCMIRDIDKKPAFILKIELKRGIYKNAEKTLTYLFISLLIITIIFSLLTIIILDKVILSRMAKITLNISHITKSDSISERIFLSGHDELANLATAINALLGALEESQEQFNNSVINSITDQIAVIDKNGIIKAVNKEWANFYKKRKKNESLTTVGMNYLDLWKKESKELPDENPEVLGGIKSVLSGIETNFTLEYKCKINNEDKWFLLNVTSMDEKNENIVISRINITKRRNTEEDRKKLIVAVEQAEEGIIITDIYGNIEYLNPAFEKIAMYKIEELKGKKIDTLKYKKKNFYHTLIEKITKGEVWRGIISEKRDGIYYELETTISPVKTKKGKTINYVAIIRDVTKENKIKRQLTRSQKFEEIGTLAGSIAHDFNNILGSIIGYTEISLQLAEEDFEIKDNLKHLLKSSNRARELVKQILGFTRQHQHEKKNIHLRQIIEEVSILIRASIPATIEIKKHLALSVDIINGDANQLQLALTNLLIYSAAHLIKEKSGTIEISLSEKIISNEINGSELKPGIYIHLSIKSVNNKGTECLLFDKEENPVENLTDMSAIDSIIKSHNGTIKVESDKSGNTFNLFFPTFIPPEEKNKDIVFKSGNILFIDDDADLMFMNKMIINNLGHNVTGTTNPLEAIEILKNSSEEFDLVITDYSMPSMTGLTLAKEVVKIKPHIPIILCTGYNENLTIEELAKFNIKEILIKPIEMHVLSNNIDWAMNGEED